MATNLYKYYSHTQLILESFCKKLDFHNRSETPSEEIEAVYYYTGDKWNYYLEGQECPCTKSDLPGFSMRHLIKLPVRRLNPRGGWAQAKVKGEKIIAYIWDQEGKKFE